MRTENIKAVCLIGLGLLVGCNGAEEETVNQSLSAANILGSEDVEGYLRVLEPRNFSFPLDHGPHPGFRNEWWYVTGNVLAETGIRFGYQITFFSGAIRPEADVNCVEDNAWCSNRIWMGHAALSDIGNEVHYAAELFSRENPGLAGAKLNPLRVWIQDWQLFSASNDFPWELEVITDEFSLSLQITAQKKPVLQGENGLSQKSPETGNASYYYSMTRMLTTGQIHIDGESLNVNGSSWLDREWSTSALADDQSGWDWFSLQFDDNQELMYYQLRDKKGMSHSSSQGNWTDQFGNQTLITPEQMKLTPVNTWLSADGVEYTTEWLMEYAGNKWIIKAVFEDQLMDLSFQYWEGSIEIIGFSDGRKLGAGYLEVVR